MKLITISFALLCFVIATQAQNTILTLTINYATTNGACDTTNSCDIACTSSNNRLSSGGVQSIFSLPLITDNNTPTWNKLVNITVPSYSAAATVNFECFEDDAPFSTEGPWSLTQSFSVPASNSGTMTVVNTNAVGPYITSFRLTFNAKCATNYYGLNCSEFCQPGSPSACLSCNSTNGFCTCATGYTGKDCNTCATNYYAYNGTCRFCVANSGGCYACDATGAKVCCSTHEGANCDILKSCGSLPAPPSGGYLNYNSTSSPCNCTTVGCSCQYKCTTSNSTQTITCNSSKIWPNVTLSCLIDECLLGTHTCNQTCIDTPTSYDCDCVTGFTKVGDGKGLTGCANVNECLESNGGCQQTCIDTFGSYYCACGAGYTLDSDNKSCTNIDECSVEGGNGCSPNAVCADTCGSYTCTCNPGFSGDGFNCTDINECATSSLSNCSQLCTNTPGSYYCSCADGYTQNGDATGEDGCVNIDECEVNNGDCETTCTDTPGSYYCSCDFGYALNEDGKTCTNINECADSNGGCEFSCTDTPGSYYCSCDTGYTLNQDSKSCRNINECSEGGNNCSENAFCNDTCGGFFCSCKPGFSGNGTVCN